MTGTVQYVEPPLRPPAQVKLRRRRSFWRKLSLAILLLFLTGAATIFYLSGYDIGRSCQLLGYGLGYAKDKAFHVPPFQGKRQVNLLLLGADEPMGGAARTDTIKLITVDLAHERISMLSIPRDTWVTLPNGSEGRINGAHMLGKNNREQSIAYAKTAVSDLIADLLGEPIQIDRYIRVQTKGFVGIVDALGGIEIDVEKQMDYEDPSQDLFIHLKPGLQRLDGRQAVGYVRFRHDADGDYGRIKRQDAFLRTLAAQINQPDEKERLLKLIGPMMEMVSTDISVNDALAVKALVSKIGMDGIQSVELPTVPTHKGAASVVEVRDREAGMRAVHELLHGPRPTVLVLNGSRRSGLARNARESISRETFNVVGLGTTTAPVDASCIFTSEKNVAAAQRLAEELGLPTVVNTTTFPPAAKVETPSAVLCPAQITVVLGNDYQRIQAAGMQPVTRNN